VQRIIPKPFGRFNRIDAVVTLPLLLFLSIGWTSAGIAKLIDPGWWTGDTLHQWLAVQHEAASPLMSWVAVNVFTPLVVPISFVVLVAHFALGGLFLTQFRLRPTLLGAIFFNVVFMLMGDVAPSALYIMIQITLLVAVDLGLIGDSPRSPSREVSLVWGATALAAIPFISTLHPARAMTDPGIVLATLAIIGGTVEVYLLWLHGKVSFPRRVAAYLPPVADDVASRPSGPVSTETKAHKIISDDDLNYWNDVDHPYWAQRQRTAEPDPQEVAAAVKDAQQYYTEDNSTHAGFDDLLPNDHGATPTQPDHDFDPQHTNTPNHAYFQDSSYNRDSTYNLGVYGQDWMAEAGGNDYWPDYPAGNSEHLTHYPQDSHFYSDDDYARFMESIASTSAHPADNKPDPGHPDAAGHSLDSAWVATETGTPTANDQGAPAQIDEPNGSERNGTGAEQTTTPETATPAFPGTSEHDSRLWALDSFELNVMSPTEGSEATAQPPNSPPELSTNRRFDRRDKYWYAPEWRQSGEFPQSEAN